MSNPFFERPILNSPYDCPRKHWELDEHGQPTQRIIETRRKAEFITPIPKPRKRSATSQGRIIYDEGKGLSTEKQEYDPTPIINEVRQRLEGWRSLRNPSDWLVTPETARLLQHWRSHKFSGIRPFFCQIEAVETAIWLTEGHPTRGDTARASSTTCEKTFALWEKERIRVPPCFIVVCNNTSSSKLVYDFISGFHRENEDGSSSFQNGRLTLFRNFDDYGNALPRPNTILIDSEELEAGEPLDENFRKMADDEIARFRRERIERSGDAREGENITDQELLREVMNTVGKYGQLGGNIRCVVSVSMLTEGWDANTVTHVLGVRAFGTQLLCEQVIGRALRRQSYELNEDGPNQGLFNVEYADILGVPFDFAAKPVVAAPQPPRETIEVKAVRPDRNALEIRFPRVVGYRVELANERLSAAFTPDSVLELTPELVGATETRNSGIIGQSVDLSLAHTSEMRPSQVLYHLTSHLILEKWRDPGEEPRLHLFGQMKRIVRQWLDGGYLVCKGGTYPAQLMYKMLANMACDRIMSAIVRASPGQGRIAVTPDAYNPIGSTAHVRFNTTKADRWETAANRCHINWVILDSDWEAEFCRVAEAHPRVRAYAKNHNLGLEVPYRQGSEPRVYRPDFIVLVDDGHGDDDTLHLVIEIKGYRREDAKEKKDAMETYWIPGVNNAGRYGRWAFAEFTEVYQIQADFAQKVESEFEKMIERVAPVPARL